MESFIVEILQLCSFKKNLSPFILCLWNWPRFCSGTDCSFFLLHCAAIPYFTYQFYSWWPLGSSSSGLLSVVILWTFLKYIFKNPYMHICWMYLGMELLDSSFRIVLDLVAFKSFLKWLTNWITFEQCLKVPVALYLLQPFDSLCDFFLLHKPY